MTSYADLVAQARRRITEIQPGEVEGASRTIVDIREPDEHAAGTLAGAIHVPRGILESAIEASHPDRSNPILLFCAGGARSALAAAALTEMGYTDVASLAGGFNGWKEADGDWVVPETMAPDQRMRYSRHLLLPEVGEAGQHRLLSSSALLIGAGGLGSPAALYLAAAGVGRIGIVDNDAVDASNLQRQIIHTTERIGTPKVASARQALSALNPDVKVDEYPLRLTAENALEILAPYDVIVDGGDNFPTRYLINDASLHLGIPVVHGSIFRFEGQVSVFDPFEGPCYRCLFPQPPPPELAPSCAEAGVLGVLPGIIGSIQAMEALKLLLSIGETLNGRLLIYDGLDEEFHTVKVERRDDCLACSDPERAPELVDYDLACSAPDRVPRR